MHQTLDTDWLAHQLKLLHCIYEIIFELDDDFKHKRNLLYNKMLILQLGGIINE